MNLLIKSKGKFYQLIKGEEVNNFNVGMVVGLNGIFQYNKSVAHEIISPLEESKIIDEIEEKSTYNYPPISFAVYQESLNFLRKAYSKTQGEACVLLTLNRKIALEGQEYKIRIPKQTVTGSSVDYKLADIYSEFEDGEFLAGSIHSHPDFSAFQSSTDLTDEQNFDGPHITLGYIEKPVPEIHGRICLVGKSYDVKNLSNILSVIPPVELKDTNKDWLDMVNKESNKWQGSHNNYPYDYGHLRGNQQYLFNSNWKDGDELFKMLKPKEPINQKSNTKLKLMMFPENFIKGVYE